ncbi:formate--tetrahydrofolate ligase [Nitrincola alkalilacustris]|uniref:formate--tetrahydrofolate ligase n=1 Tax=Nitrincola alkalilacustris TaxID=1571224 RepID=UPI00124F18ED|nr:formate--tetrahydrofolate ligase [Nitrincola alkalilacustris]
MPQVPSDLEIARAAKMQPINQVADSLTIPAEALLQYGPYKAKLSNAFIRDLHNREDGKLILVTAMTPTPAGEGKTTTTVGLGDALKRLGHKTVICLREPSLGPCFGIKGGAAGGGYAQVVPMEDINLHFTGDFHAITSANNLLAAMLDNHIHWGNELGIDQRRVAIRRVMDMNDRALRHIVNGMGGVGNGFVREDGFDITVASEVMAIFCLSRDLIELNERLGKIIVARNREGDAITAADLKANGAMTVLLKDAFSPNLVQTLENTPAFVHGGPFANIAHGCNSVVATTTALKLGEYVVTEAGFGADLGAEKFFNIKCRKAGLKPSVAVVVATVRALKMHGGVALADLAAENVEAVAKGCANLTRHIRNVKAFGVPVVVAINRFTGDTQAELDAVLAEVQEHGAEVSICNHWAEGGAGAEELAQKVVHIAESGTSQFAPLYDSNLPLWDKIKVIATTLYGAHDIMADKKVRQQITDYQQAGYGHFPICMAKTQYSFSTDPNLKGAPYGHEVPIREVRLSGGAEFLVVVCGDIMTMPGLPRKPSAEQISLDEEGNILGLS